MEADLLARLTACEGRLRMLSRAMAFGGVLLILAGGVTLLYLTSPAADAQSTLPAIRASEIVIVDPGGVERVRIGGQLPDAIVDGKPRPRGQRAAGVLLYDDTGRERSGYVTFSPLGNVALTLDGRQGQSALFVSDPDGSTALRMWRGDHWIELRNDTSGARVSAGRDGAVVFQQPPVAEVQFNAYCTRLKEAGQQKGASERQLLAACRDRFGEQECRSCVAGQ